uniref:Uncharacterized protein n=1 Tax=Panagrolaimus sp. ES5 TaxID=591445 RepID=A0AC34GI11_9BILA
MQEKNIGKFVGEDYEGVLVRLQQERDHFNITNEYQPALQPDFPLPLSSQQHVPLRSHEPQSDMAIQQASPMPSVCYEPAPQDIPQHQHPY